MRRRQTVPNRWLIAGHSGAESAMTVARRLRREDGIILLEPVPQREFRRLRSLALSRGVAIVIEQSNTAARVHDIRELRCAMLARVPLILLSPIFPTASHPGWKAIPRMRAAAFARLGKRRLLALGGMTAKRYARVAPLGFIGWAGVSAFRT